MRYFSYFSQKVRISSSFKLTVRRQFELNIKLIFCENAKVKNLLHTKGRVNVVLWYKKIMFCRTNVHITYWHYIILYILMKRTYSLNQTSLHTDAVWSVQTLDPWLFIEYAEFPHPHSSSPLPSNASASGIQPQNLLISVSWILRAR